MSKAKKAQKNFQQAFINQYGKSSSSFDGTGFNGIGEAGPIGLVVAAGAVAVAGVAVAATTLMATNPKTVFDKYPDLTPAEKANILSQPIDQQGNTALHLAAEAGDPDMVQWLVKNGANPEAINAAGLKADQLSSNTTLEAIRATGRSMVGSSQDSAIQKYLKGPAKTDAANFRADNNIAYSIPIQPSKSPPLYEEATKPQKPATEALPTDDLEAKRKSFIALLNANPKTKIDTVNSALEAMTPAEKIYILSKPDEKKNTLLHKAAKFKDLDLVKVLVQHGANIYALNEEHMTPELEADGEVEKYLKQTSVKINSFMKLAKEGNQTEIETALKTDPWLLEAKNEYGETASDIALSNGQEATVNFLTAEKAKLSKEDEDLASQYAPSVLTGKGKDEEEDKVITYGNYPGIENLNFSDTALVGEPLGKDKTTGHTLKRFGNAAEGGTVLETYDKKKGFQYKIEPQDGDPPGKVYKIEVPRMGDDGKIIPGEVDTLVFNRDGELLEYKAPSDPKGTCRLDEDWLKGLNEAREAALGSRTKMTTLDGVEDIENAKSSSVVSEMDAPLKSALKSKGVSSVPPGRRVTFEAEEDAEDLTAPLSTSNPLRTNLHALDIQSEKRTELASTLLEEEDTTVNPSSGRPIGSSLNSLTQPLRLAANPSLDDADLSMRTRSSSFSDSVGTTKKGPISIIIPTNSSTPLPDDSLLARSKKAAIPKQPLTEREKIKQKLLAGQKKDDERALEHHDDPVIQQGRKGMAKSDRIEGSILKIQRNFRAFRKSAIVEGGTSEIRAPTDLPITGQAVIKSEVGKYK